MLAKAFRTAAQLIFWETTDMEMQTMPGENNKTILRREMAVSVFLYQRIYDVESLFRRHEAKVALAGLLCAWFNTPGCCCKQMFSGYTASFYSR